jgi:hypothetical protein
MTEEQIIQAVRAYVKTELSLTDGQVIVANERGQRPAGAHVSVQVVSDVAVSRGGSVGSASGGSLYTAQECSQASVLVICYGSSAATWAEALRTRWCTERPAADAVRTAGLAPLSPSATSDLSTSVDGAWERRRGLTLDGYHATTSPATAARVAASVTLTGTTSPASATFTISQELDP